jgi:hypothetical protein
MSLLKQAIEKQQWNLAAHIIVLAAARVVNREVKSHGKENRKKSRCSKR